MTTATLRDHALTASILACALSLISGCDDRGDLDPQDLDGLELQDLEQLSPAELEALELALDEQAEEPWSGASELQPGTSPDEETVSLRYIDWNGGRAGDAENTSSWGVGNSSDIDLYPIDITGNTWYSRILQESGWEVNEDGNLAHNGVTGQSLVGRVLTITRPGAEDETALIWLKIAAVNTQGAFHEYRVEYMYQAFQHWGWRSICADPNNPWSVAIADTNNINPYSGVHQRNNLMSFYCTSKAAGKAKRWGYDPNIDGDDVFMAAKRMVMADYCGTGRSFTADGTPIKHVFTGGASRAPGSYAEAGWDENGVVCLNYQYSRSVHAQSVVQSECGGVLPPPCSASQERSALTWSKLSYACGNNVVEPGEQCDYGNQNGSHNSDCRSDCTWDPNIMT